MVNDEKRPMSGPTWKYWLWNRTDTILAIQLVFVVAFFFGLVLATITRSTCG